MFQCRTMSRRYVVVTRFKFEIATAQTQCEIGDWFGIGLNLAMRDFDLAFSEPDFLILS